MKILVAYSGGKDSQAALIWAISQYGRKHTRAVFCDTGHEHPATYKHIEETTKALDVELVTLRSPRYESLFDMAKQRKRFPSTKARFCTEFLKYRPMIDYVLSLQEHFRIIQGIRKDESENRSKMLQHCNYFRYYLEPYKYDNDGKPVYQIYRKKEVRAYAAKFLTDVERPIFEWTAQETIDYILANGQQPNPLYYKGMERVGCFPCIQVNQKELKTIIENFPETFDKLKQAEANVGTNFFPPNYIPKRACSNRKFPTAADVEKYIKGKNQTGELFEQDTTNDAPRCMSYYHLCE